ncbi:MAG: proteasome accessory factor PafA2 family protein, partial [Candidatus Saccharimonadales bacterium]
LEDYGYLSSAYRISLKDDTAYNHRGGRVEIRCNDINISPWAVQARLGGSALLLTILKTPLADRLKDSNPTHVVSLGTRIKHFRRYNHATFTPEFELQPTRNLLHALDYQERIWDLADSDLAKYVDVPEEYETIIHELQYYCQDFRQVLKGELDLSVLANRSDNAAKFAKIISTTRKVNEGATTRPLNSIFARAYDMAYDMIEVSAGSSPTTPRVTRGYGYRLRDKGKFRLPLKPRAVEDALYRPPQTTRAALRGQAIREGKAEAVTWSGIYNTERFQFRSLGPALRDESNIDLEMLGIV